MGHFLLVPDQQTVLSIFPFGAHFTGRESCFAFPFKCTGLKGVNSLIHEPYYFARLVLNAIGISSFIFPPTQLLNRRDKSH